MMSEDAELISIYYGADITEEAAEAFRNQIAEKYSACDVELQYGGQPIYYYVMSVEKNPRGSHNRTASFFTFTSVIIA